MEATKQAIVVVDVFGGDGKKGIAPVIKGSVAALCEDPNLEVILIGPQQPIYNELARLGRYANRVVARTKIIDARADQVIKQIDTLKQILRKTGSPLHLGFDLIRNNQAHALISSAHTGGLTSLAKKKLGVLSTNIKPILISRIPTSTGIRLLTDVGANGTCNAEDLAKYAEMARIYATQVMDIPNPTIGIINSRSEDDTGSDLSKAANELFKTKSTFGYRGYIEPNDFRTDSHVYIAIVDGYCGNLVLKAYEGDAKFIAEILKRRFKWLKFLVPIIIPALMGVRHDIYPPECAHAYDVGVNGIVIKVHGSCEDWKAYEFAILSAAKAARNDFLAKIKQGLAA